MVIESFCELYMVARVTGAATVRTRQNKNPLPYHGRLDKRRVLLRSFVLPMLGSFERW